MKPILPALLVIAGALGGCASVSGGSDLVSAVQQIASDPRCGHTDRISGNLGGLTGNNLNVFLERTCPAQPSALVSVEAPPT
jgi:hypothetical protein